MGLSLMSPGGGNVDVLAWGRSFSSTVGITVYNIAVMNTVILQRYADGSYLAHIDVTGSQIGTSSSTTDFPWLSPGTIVAKALQLTQTNHYTFLANDIPFRNQNIMNDSGYGAIVHFDNSRDLIEAGRIYNSSGYYGGWAMGSLKPGNYAFDLFVQLYD